MRIRRIGKVSSAGRLRILSLIPGRVRLHLSGWTAGDVEWVETRLCQVNGVESVQANPLTENVLIRFDRRTTGEKTLLVELEEAWEGLLAAQQRVEAPGSKPRTQDGTRHSVEGRGPSTSSLMRVGGGASLDMLPWTRFGSLLDCSVRSSACPWPGWVHCMSSWTLLFGEWRWHQAPAVPILQRQELSRGGKRVCGGGAAAK